jgi:hypothetical protein
MKVKELIEKLQSLNHEYDVKVVAYNENAQCSKKCNITDASESAYYRNINDNDLYHYVVINYSFKD